MGASVTCKKPRRYGPLSTEYVWIEQEGERQLWLKRTYKSAFYFSRVTEKTKRRKLPKTTGDKDAAAPGKGKPRWVKTEIKGAESYLLGQLEAAALVPFLKHCYRSKGG